MDEAWNEVHRDRVWGRYPPEELVRFIAKNFQQPASEPPPMDGLSFSLPDMSKFKALDLGCGAGACTWYLAREGFRVIGLDGSIEGLRRACARFEEEKFSSGGMRFGPRLVDGMPPPPGVKATHIEAHAPHAPTLVQGYLQYLPFADNYFDVTIDVCSIQHNTLEHMQSILVEVHRVLKSGGMHFSMMVAKNSWGDECGERLGPGTYTNSYTGPYRGLGRIHFTRRAELEHLFAPFSVMDSAWTKRSILRGSKKIKHWIVEARK